MIHLRQISKVCKWQQIEIFKCNVNISSNIIDLLNCNLQKLIYVFYLYRYLSTQKNLFGMQYYVKNEMDSTVKSSAPNRNHRNHKNT